MSLLSPPAYLPETLVPAWPWIWLQHVMLRAWLRLTYGRGHPYCWAITDSGRVELVWIDTGPQARAVPRLVQPAACPRLVQALSGDALMAPFLRTLLPARPARIYPALVSRQHAMRALALPLPLPDS